MAWTYNNTTGILTSTGGTEASPDSLLAGIAIVQTTNAARGYANGLVAWLNNIQIEINNSVILIDIDLQVELRGSSYINPLSAGGNGGVIHGQRSHLIFNTTTARGNIQTGFPDLGLFITRKDKPNDPSPRITYKNTVRMDYPSLISPTARLNKADVNGLDLYAGSLPASNFFRMFFAHAIISNLNSIRVFDSSTGVSGSFPNGLNLFLYDGTYTDLYREKNDFGSELNVINEVNLLTPTYYGTTPSPLVGFMRLATFNVLNPTFLNNCWNGLANFGGSGAANLRAESKLEFKYSYLNTIKEGLTNLENVRLQFTRARQSVNGSPTWVVPNSTINVTTNVSGTYNAVNLIDTYREGKSTSDLERFNWSLKARKYDKKTAGENVFTNRVLYKHSVDMSAGYSEEIQMLNVPFITLTEVQALAITGIVFTPSGATNGVITISENRTVSELWQAYRAWISQTDNFESEDTWSYDGVTLNMGGWTLSGAEFLSGGAITTTSATSNGMISDLTINGDVLQAIPTNILNVNITGTLTYNTNTTTSISITNTQIGIIQNDGTGIVTISPTNSSITDYTDSEINYLDSSIEVIGANTTTVYPTVTDRNNNTNALATFTTKYPFKYGAPWIGTVYLQVDIGFVAYKDVTLAIGENVVDLGTTGLLASIQSNMALEVTSQTIKTKTDILTNTDISTLATSVNVTEAQTTIVNEVNANETKIDTIKADTDAIKNKTDVLVNAPSLSQIEASTVLAKESTSQAIKGNTDLIPATI